MTGSLWERTVRSVNFPRSLVVRSSLFAVIQREFGAVVYSPSSFANKHEISRFVCPVTGATYRST